ncbi:7969_t:CDS:2, partial [Funneliformis mosseae]
MSMPSTPNINDDETTFDIANESAKNINDEMDFKQSSTQDEFFSFINLNDNIEHIENNSDDNSSETDSFDELIHIEDNEDICVDTEDSDDENEITKIIIEKNNKICHFTCAIMVMDPKTEEINKCQNPSIRKLWQLVKIWEINSESVKIGNARSSKLSVCKTHFNLDQNFHETDHKAKISTEQSMITIRKCLFYNLDIYIISCEKLCYSHS